MRARDYRIGNYVTIPGEVQYIIGIESNMDWNDEYGFASHLETIRTNLNPMNMSKDGLMYVSEAEPIPLTEEWLEKFGFNSKYKSIHTQWNFYDFYIHQKSDVDDDGGDLPTEQVFYYDFRYEIKTVHQLQNLYHSLTGKELTLKTTA
jgi:hypothetical protein